MILILVGNWKKKFAVIFIHKKEKPSNIQNSSPLNTCQSICIAITLSMLLTSDRLYISFGCYYKCDLYVIFNAYWTKLFSNCWYNAIYSGCWKCAMKREIIILRRRTFKSSGAAFRILIECILKCSIVRRYFYFTMFKIIRCTCWRFCVLYEICGTTSTKWTLSLFSAQFKLSNCSEACCCSSFFIYSKIPVI